MEEFKMRPTDSAALKDPTSDRADWFDDRRSLFIRLTSVIRGGVFASTVRAKPRFHRFVLVLAFLVLGATLDWAQTNTSGFWVLRVPTGDGNFRETFFELKQDGETVTG